MNSHMSRFGMYAKVIAKPGQRDTLAEHLLEAAGLMAPIEGCETYIVNLDPSGPDAIWVTEVWRSEADHDASLQLESVRALVAKTKPLVADFQAIRLQPLGGKGLPISGSARS